MRKDQSIWKDRQEQSVFGKSISTLVGIKFGSIFISEDQGGGEVSILVLKGRGVSDNKMKEVKRYIKNSFQLDEKDISLGHGHTKGTIVVNLSEINLSSKKIIEEEINNKIILPDRIKKIKDMHCKLPIKKTLPTFTPSIQIEESEKVVTQEIEVVEIQTKNKKMEKENFSIIKKGRHFFLMFLIAMFKFEGIILSGKENIFSFDENKSEDCQTINFRNEVEATMANQALTWLYGDSKMLPALDRNYIMLDFLYFNFGKRFSPNITFCFAPIKGDSVARIQKRAIRVLTGYNSSQVHVIDHESFSIKYSRLSTTEKFFDLIKGMGWDAFMQDDIIICKFRPKPEVEVVEEITPTDTPKVEEIVPKKILGQEPKLTPIISKIKDEVIPIPEDKKEVLADLQFLYANKKLFSKLPSEMQKEVIYTIRMNYMEEHTEDYARNLLAFLKK